MGAILFLLSGSLGAQARVNLTSSFPQQELTPFLEVLEDPEGTLTWEDLERPEPQAAFRALPEGGSNLGFTGSTFWFRLTVHNPGPTRLERWLVSESLFTNEIDFFPDLQAARSLQRSGSFVPLALRTVALPTPVFQLSLEPGETRVLHWRVRSVNALSFPLTAMTPAEALLQQTFQQWGVSLFWGFGLALAMYNLFLFRGLQNVSYLLYSLFLLTHLLYFSRSNFLLYLTQDLPWWVLRGSAIAGALSSVCAYLFFIQFLELKRRSRLCFVVLSTGAGVALLMGLLPFGLSDGGMRGFLQFRIAFAIISSLLLLLSAAWVMGQGYRPARYLFGAALSPFLGFLLTGLAILDWFPEALRSEWYSMGSMMLLLLLLSWGLADQMRVLRQEKLEAQQQAIRQLQEVDAFKDRLLTNTSHELKTPLHGIVGLVENLLKGEEALSRKGRVALDLIQSNSVRMARMVDDLLTRVEGGELLRARRDSVELRSLLEEVLLLLEHQAAERSLMLMSKIPDDLPSLQADAAELHQVLLNLLDNAIKYTPQGSVRLEVEVLSETRIQIRVVDTGTPIAPDEWERLVRPFERGAAPGVPGLGVGLSVVQDLLANYGSTLQLETRGPQEKAISFELPTVEAVVPQVLAAPLPANSQNPLVLVIEDDPTSQYVLMEMLQRAHYQVTLIGTGEEALKYLEDPGLLKPSLLLLDVMMPGLDGLETCELIRKSFPEEHLPILFMSALNRREDLEAVYQVGGTDYLSKPIREVELLARVRHHLQLQEETPQDREEAFKREFVQFMNDLLLCYEEVTERSLIDLAQETGWGVHLDRNTWRCRGLEQYFSFEKFPRRPQYRRVRRLVQHVFRACAEDARIPELQQRYTSLNS